MLTSLTWTLFQILTSGHWITERGCVEFQGATVRSSISEGECVGIYQSTIDAPDQDGVSSSHEPGAGLGTTGAATEAGTALLTGAADQFTRKTKRRQTAQTLLRTQTNSQDHEASDTQRQGAGGRLARDREASVGHERMKRI